MRQHDPSAIFAFTVEHKREHDGQSPSLHQLADRFVTSTSVISYHLDKLERAGYIRRPRYGSRNIEVVGGQWACSGSTAVDVEQYGSREHHAHRSN